MSNNLQNHHCICKHPINHPEVNNTLAVGCNTHNNHVSMNMGKQMRCHEGNALIGREAAVAFEEDSKDMNARSIYHSDIAIMNVRLRIGTIKDAFDDGEMGGAAIVPSRSSNRDIDHLGTELCSRITPPCAVALSCLEGNK